MATRKHNRTQADKKRVGGLLIKTWSWFLSLKLPLKLLVLALAFAVGMTSYNLIGDVIDKRQLDAIDRSLVELTERINDEFGTETLAVQRFCEHNGNKLGYGPLWCVIQTVSTTNNRMLNDFFAFTAQQSDLVVETEQFAGYDYPEGNLRLKLKRGSGWCSVSSLRSSPQEVYPRIGLDDTDYSGRVLTIRCSVQTRRNFYTNTDFY